MDYQKAFTVIFQDKEWVGKILIGGLLLIASFLIIPAFFVYGYAIEYTQRVMAGNMSLPAWDNMGEKFKKGFMVFLTLFVYTLPAFIFIALPIVFTILASVLASSSQSASQVLGFIAFIFILFGYLLFFVYLLFLYFLIPAVIVRFAQTESIGECLKVKEILGIIKTHFADILMLVLFLIVAGFIANIGIIACFIGVFFTGFYGTLVVHNLYGQFAKKLNEEAKRA